MRAGLSRGVLRMSLCCAAHPALEHSPTRLPPCFVAILSDSSGAFSVNDNGVDGFVGDDEGGVSVVGNVVAIFSVELLEQRWQCS